MHRKQGSDLILADTELERTLRSLRKTKRAENAAMAEEGHDQTEEQRTGAGRPPIIDTMEDFWRPIIQEEYSAIRQPNVDANNFELKPALIIMVQQHQFTGHPTKDPNERLGRFLRIRGGNRAGRAGLGRANSGPGQNRVGPKLARFFRATILTAQPALKTGPVGPKCLSKAKKNSGGPGRAGPYRAGPYRAGPNLARFFSGQKFNGPARP